MSEVVGREVAVSCRHKMLVYGVGDVQQSEVRSVVKQWGSSQKDVPSMPVTTTSLRASIEYFSLSLRTAQAMLLPLPALSPGMSDGWIVKSMERNFLMNSCTSPIALSSTLFSRDSMAR